MKECTKCKRVKNDKCFVGRCGGITAQCDVCREGKLRWHRDNKDRYVVSRKEYDRGYYINNTEKIKERNRKYYIENKERINKINELWRANNPDEYKLSYTNWRKTTKGIISRRSSNSRRRSRMQFTDITTKWLNNLFDKTIECELCGCIMDNNGETYPNGKQLDHIIPLGVEGLHVKRNVRFICYKCNISRPKDGSDLVNINYSLDKL